MGIEELIGRLKHDAELRVAAIETRARAEVQAIATAVDRASSQARDEALADRRARRRARLDREIAAARQRARAERLRLEYALFDRVMARAGVLLDEADCADAYLSELPARIAEALRFVEGRPARVRCRPAFASAARGAVAGRGDVTVEEVTEMPAGFSVLTRDGAVEVDETLLGRLERLRPRLLSELLVEGEP